MSQVIAPLASIGLTCKVVWHINDDSVPTGLGRPFLKVMQWMSDRVTVSSGALAGKYFGAKDAVGLGLTDILYSTVDLDDFKATRPRDATRAAFGIEPADVVVGMIGNVAPAKGQREFIEAAGLLSKRTGKRVRFLMVGRTLPLRVGYADEVKRLVDRLGLGTQLVQLGYRNDIPDLLAAMDILVVPSLWEPLGVIVMEGMAMSKPIVASNTGGIPEMVCDGRDALLIPPSNPAAMAQAVESLLDSPQFALRLAESAHARMKATFAPEAAAAMYEHLYFRLLNQTGPRVCSDISTPNTNPAND
jgi:glycosyltransferase involved in cell wall biosynthesis